MRKPFARAIVPSIAAAVLNRNACQGDKNWDVRFWRKLCGPRVRDLVRRLVLPLQARSFRRGGKHQE